MKFTLLIPLLLIPSLACRQTPPPGASGETIYILQNCANCHGESGEGTKRGPAFIELNTHWDRSAMAEFFAHPKAVAKQDARLSAMIEKFGSSMSTYDNLSQNERLRLADYLLEAP